MPKNFEYVFAAYAIWIGFFAVYVFILFRKSLRTRNALRDLTHR